MNVIKLAWKNIIFRPLQSSLSVLLLALGVGLVVILLLLQGQLNQNFDRNLAGVDLILGAKGSPLQMVMSSMYQLDAPTGNLTINEVKPFLNPRHPLIEEFIPLSMGDNFRGFRIVGATPNLINWYGGELAEGELYTRDGEGIMGAEVASVHNMSVGDSFKGDHGINADDPLHEQHAHDFVVSGILKPTGTVLDRLVLVTNQAYWKMHGEGHEDHDHEDHNHDDHAAHNGDDHDHDHEGHDHESHNHDDHAAHNGDDHDHDHEGHDHEGHNHDDHAAHNGDDHDHDHDDHNH
ncbi:MAG: ABC transporter permease, partial [Bacteroidota bacterium]